MSLNPESAPVHGRKKVTVATLAAMKERRERVVALTAYDYWMARLVDEAEVPMILVGDSLGMVMLGYPSTLPVTMEEMLHHTKAVVRGVQYGMVVGDMPFMSYQISPAQAVEQAARFIKEAGAHAVKLEGGSDVVPQVKAIVKAGIPVLGHLGLTPQSILTLGGYKVQGREPRVAKRLLEDAAALEQAGAFGVVLECVPAALAKKVTGRLRIPTIGIGAGKHCDGQVLVTHDVLGLTTWFQQPKFIKRYAALPETMREAIQRYAAEVKQGAFPDDEHSFL